MAKYSNRFRGLLLAVRELEGQVSALEAVAAERTGASPGQHAILGLLMSDAPLTVPEMGKRLDNSRQYTQRTINALAKAGLVEKQPNPKHKTSVRWRLSPMGVHAVQDLEAQKEALWAEVPTALKKKQLAGLAETLEELSGGVAKRLKAIAEGA